MAESIKRHGRKRRETAGFSEEDLKPYPEQTMVLVPHLPRHDADKNYSSNDATIKSRSLDGRLEEAKGLARAIGLEIVHSEIVLIKSPKPGTLFGIGKIKDWASIIRSNNIGLVIVDHALTPVQQRNLESDFNAKVMDRTGLILEIFGERAQTKEGRLQVDLAHLTYQKSRLVRSWTHLERQRGGAGFMGGPGETQIEADRRMIQSRMSALQKDLEKVSRTRALHRARRQRVPHPVVALVGYTNAGKSTLFNRITKADVLAQDMLFATLDPTMRRLHLPKGTRVILSDTVGFVSNLPTTLVAAFRATLEEVIEAELILHVRDVGHEDFAAQGRDVEQVLEQLGINTQKSNLIEIWNKIDTLSDEQINALDQRNNVNGQKPVLVSSLTGKGMSDLMALIEDNVTSGSKLANITVTPANMSVVPWVYEKGNVVTREDLEDGSINMQVRLSYANYEALRRKL